MADFIHADLRGSRFERVDLSGAQLRAVDLSGARFRGVDLSGAVMRGVELVDADIHGEILDLTINGIDIGPLVEAELDRRYPDRAKMRPADPAGFRQAWDLLSGLSTALVLLPPGTVTLGTQSGADASAVAVDAPAPYAGMRCGMMKR
ncbi:MAG TPA: pentapeptide repeat-containing protein [Streptosporangiaceae bacterium]